MTSIARTLTVPNTGAAQLERQFLDKLRHFEELVSDWQNMRRMSDAQSAKTRAVSNALAEARCEQMTKVAEELTSILHAIVTQNANHPRY